MTDTTPGRETVGYQLTAVNVEMILQDTLEVDTKFCAPTVPSANARRRLQTNDATIFAAGTTGASAPLDVAGAEFEQNFRIEFKEKVTNANADFIYRSGNPGYMHGSTLIVGQEPDPAKPQKIAKNGFMLLSHNNQGKCFVKDAAKLFDYPSRSLYFHESAMMSCAVPLTLTDLEAYCSGTAATKFQDLELFKQFNDRFKAVGKFGSVNPLYKKDWVPVLNAFTDTKQFDGTKWLSNKWDAASGTCKSAVVGYDIKIYYSKMGFTNKLQLYTMGATIEPIVDDMVFNNMAAGTEAQDFGHLVQISYHEIVSNELLKAAQAEAPFFLPDVFEDVFYPFTLNY